jgi:hypothetical protein
VLEITRRQVGKCYVLAIRSNKEVGVVTHQNIFSSCSSNSTASPKKPADYPHHVNAGISAEFEHERDGKSETAA